MNTSRGRRRAVALALLSATVLLAGCQASRSAEAESARITTALAKLPGVVGTSAEHQEAIVGYPPKVDVFLEMREDADPAVLMAVLDEWRRLSPQSSDSLVVRLNGNDCGFTADWSLPPHGLSDTLLFFRSLCDAFPGGSLWFDLQHHEASLQLELPASGADDTGGAVDDAVLTRIHALPGADAPVAPWYIGGAGDERFHDYAPSGPGRQP